MEPGEHSAREEPMAIKKARKYPKHIQQKLANHLLEKEYQLFGKYAKSDEETRAMADKELGDKTLTEVLYEMREEGL
jgi:hypothetical protein